MLSAIATLEKTFCGSVEPACPSALEIFLSCNDVKHSKFYFFHHFNARDHPLCQGQWNKEHIFRVKILSLQFYDLSMLSVLFFFIP